MRSLLAILSLFISITLCHAQSQLEATDACACLNDEVIATILGWDASSIVKTDDTFGRRRSLCMIKGPDSDVLYVRLGWKSEKAQENGVLQNQFKTYLTQGEGDMTYSKVEDTDTIEALVGSQSLPGNMSMAIARKRYGNEAEVQIEISGEGDVDKMLKQVQSLLAKVN